eukprot:COSAG01_NODE_37621_length_501_cov_0.609453_1_plen_44_part_10
MGRRATLVLHSSATLALRSGAQLLASSASGCGNDNRAAGAFSLA